MGRTAEDFRQWESDTIEEGGAEGLPTMVPETSAEGVERPGFLGSLKKGLFAPPADWGGEADPGWVSDPNSDEMMAASDATRSLMLPANAGFSPPAGHNPAPPEPPEPSIYDQIPEPSGFIEGLGYDIGYHAPMLAGGLAAAPTLGASAGLGAIPALMLEGASSVSGLSAGRGAEAAGAPPLVQSAADILASVAVPGAVITAGPRVVGRLARAPAGAVEASQEVVEYLASRGAGNALPPGGRPPEADDAYEAAIQLQRQFPLGVEDPAKFRNLGAGRIEDVQRQFPDANRQPSLAQAMSGSGTDDLGGMNIAKREMQYAAADPDYASAAYGRRLETEEWVEQAYQEELPEFAGYASTRSTARTVLDEADAEASRLWLEVKLEKVPKVLADDLLAEVKKMRADAPAAPHIPREAAAIEKMAKENFGFIPYPMLQSLSSELSMSDRAAEAAGEAAEGVWRRGIRVRRLQPIVERMLDEADPGDVAELRTARAATKRAKELRTPIVDEIIRNGDPVDVLSRIRRSDDIAETTMETRSILGEEGVAGLRAAAWDEIFGEALGSRTPHAMRRTMESRNNRQLYEAIFEPEQLQIIRQTINRQARATQGRAATSGQANSTGTGYRTDVIEALEALGRGNGSLTARSLETVRRGYRRLGEATPQSMSIEKLASQDLELARLLLMTPTPDNLPAMASVWRQALTRAQRRSPGSFTTKEATQAATRNADEGLEVPPHPDDLARIRAMRNPRP